MIVIGVALVCCAPASAGTANCPTCREVSEVWRSPTYYITYDPARLLCVEPYDKDWDCRTSPQYVQHGGFTIHIWDPEEQEWITITGDGNYNPCWTDDTECWRYS